jgi:hypothetical protein
MDLAAGCNLPGLLRIVLEEIARLQRFDGRIVRGRRKMEIAGIVAVLQDAVADPSLQVVIAVECRNECCDLAMPIRRGAILELICDHEVFHWSLLS